MFCMFVLDILNPTATDLRHFRILPGRARDARPFFIRSLRSYLFDRFGRITQARALCSLLVMEAGEKGCVTDFNII